MDLEKDSEKLTEVIPLLPQKKRKTNKRKY
jgi:hypothetical protein